MLSLELVAFGVGMVIHSARMAARALTWVWSVSVSKGQWMCSSWVMRSIAEREALPRCACGADVSHLVDGDVLAEVVVFEEHAAVLAVMMRRSVTASRGPGSPLRAGIGRMACQSLRHGVSRPKPVRETPERDRVADHTPFRCVGSAFRAKQ
jgi:hypothetical protein